MILRPIAKERTSKRSKSRIARWWSCLFFNKTSRAMFLSTSTIRLTHCYDDHLQAIPFAGDHGRSAQSASFGAVHAKGHVFLYSRLIQRIEWLVQQNQIRNISTIAAAIPRRCFMPREYLRKGLCRMGSVRHDATYRQSALWNKSLDITEKRKILRQWIHR